MIDFLIQLHYRNVNLKESDCFLKNIILHKTRFLTFTGYVIGTMLKNPVDNMKIHRGL